MSKILIIDDDPDVRTVMNILLKKQGYAVESAARPDEALQKIALFRPALILLDVLLSGADGRELCRQIKANPATASITVIMFSAHPGASENFAAYGADDFMTKPFNQEGLLRKVQQALDSTLDEATAS